jgi:hypothetical protein
MAGQIKKLIDTIIEKRAKGNNAIVSIMKTKMILKGINPDSFNVASPDDPDIVQRLLTIAQESGIFIKL